MEEAFSSSYLVLPEFMQYIHSLRNSFLPSVSSEASTNQPEDHSCEQQAAAGTAAQRRVWAPVQTGLHSPAEALQGGRGVADEGAQHWGAGYLAQQSSAEVLLWTKPHHAASRFGKRYPEMLKRQLGGFSNACWEDRIWHTPLLLIPCSHCWRTVYHPTPQACSPVVV